MPSVPLEPTRQPLPGRLPRPLALVAEALLIVLLYTAVARWLLSPAFVDPTRNVVDMGVINGDLHLHMWILSWVWHALTTHPLGLVDANAFHPAVSVLALSEHMLGHLPIFGPVYAVSGNPVLAMQVDILSSFILSAAAMYALLRHWRAP